MINYTFQDLLGSFLATMIFPIVLLIPGYVIGWWLNVFEFRKRRPVTQHIMGIVLSNCISPIALFLLYRFTSATFALLCLFLCLIAYLFIVGSQIARRIKHPAIDSPLLIRYRKYAVLMAVTVVILLIALLVDIQIRNRLYFSTASFDLTTRVAVVDAITRTGVPPINPGYYPGHPVQLNYLYYFWYILGSVVDGLGRSHINAYQAMIAGNAWAGLSLITTLTLYMRLRNNDMEARKYRMPFLSSVLLLIGGLDFVPVLMAIIQDKVLLGRLPYDGHLESWNTPVMTWGNAMIWVPHHITSMLACITAMLLIIYTKHGTFKQKSNAVILAGFAFASAAGLSVWIMFTFTIFWGIWFLVAATKKKMHDMILQMVTSGILALLLALPFLIGLIRSGGANSTQGLFPVALYIRPFMAIIYFDFLPYTLQSVINFLFLPLNYLFEFGFFLIMAILWIHNKKETLRSGNPYYIAEMALVVSITILLSFIHSNVIIINDLGIRGWLPLQFVLIVWSTDLLSERFNPSKSWLTTLKSLSDNKRLGDLLYICLVIGLLSTLTDLVAVRIWPILVDLNIVGFPNELSSDTKLGERTFAARQTYDYIREHVPEDTIIQSNPLIELDRPGGLYGDHQMAIADRTAYGVSADEFKRMTEGIGKIFELENISDWKIPDDICTNYSINIIIVNDIDPLWSSLNTLALSRPPVYKNEYYAVFNCGQ